MLLQMPHFSDLLMRLLLLLLLMPLLQKGTLRRELGHQPATHQNQSPRQGEPYMLLQLPPFSLLLLVLLLLLLILLLLLPRAMRRHELGHQPAMHQNQSPRQGEPYNAAAASAFPGPPHAAAAADAAVPAHVPFLVSLRSSKTNRFFKSHGDRYKDDAHWRGRRSTGLGRGLNS